MQINLIRSNSSQTFPKCLTKSDSLRKDKNIPQIKTKLIVLVDENSIPNISQNCRNLHVCMDCKRIGWRSSIQN